tara:strand:+ start:4247 stop:5389 length:1143 start_codon:yes stop_codon:yes gene_type:complete
MKSNIISILRKLKILFFFDYLRKIRFFYLRNHFPYLKLDFTSAVVKVRNVSDIDEQLYDRMFKSVRSELGYEPTGLWTDIFDEYQADAVRLIKEGNKDGLLKMLQSPLSNNIQYGFDNLAKVLQSNFRLETINEAKTTSDHFLALGEYTLASRYFSPEGLVSPLKERVDINKIVNKIVNSVFNGKCIFPNPYIGERGMATEYGIASIRTPAAIYQSIRVLDLGKNICEIGPGLGRTAYFSKLLGAQRYTLVDLPIPSLCQSYFLGTSLPNETFIYNHETSKNQKAIKFQQPESFLNDNEKYDVILNVDSLTEMGADAAKTYLRNFIGKSDWLLSINHEGNEFTVREIASELNEYTLISRSRSWVRLGYVEELYKIEKSSQ